MTNAAPTPCHKPGCPAVCVESFCPAHAGHAEKQADAVRQRYEAQRGNSAPHGYSHRWRKLRLHILRRDPTCNCAQPGCTTCCGRGCACPSVDIHHILSLVRGGSDAAVNVQGLCHDCHSYKTATENGSFSHRGRGMNRFLKALRGGR
jgi:5-methylcytosine-specific restriction protein A